MGTTESDLQIDDAVHTAMLEPCQAKNQSEVRAALEPLGLWSQSSTERAQYPLIKEYTLNYRGLNIMI